MPSDLAALSVTTVALALLHCLSGPDHYVPFVAMARLGVWSLRKTLVVTMVCGLGHVASSAALGGLGIALGLVVFQLTETERIRGDIAGWLLIAFGLSYLAAGVVIAIRKQSDAAEVDGCTVNGARQARRRETPSRLVPWGLFVIFLFGPCEPLIPLMMYPAARADLGSAVWITVLFGVTTLATMTTVVALMHQGVQSLRLPGLHRFGHRYGHALAGLAIVSCGLAVLGGF